MNSTAKLNKVTRSIAFFLVIAMVITSVASPITTKAAVTYSETVSYSNPLGSGEVSYTYCDGKVTYSNSTVTDKVMTNTSVAAVNSDEAICQAFDEYGTLWVVYRNSAIYWYNYEILGKVGVLQKWKGETNSQFDLEALSLEKKGTNANYATHYTNQYMKLIPLPTWNVLYELVNDKPFQSTTETPVTTTETPITTTETPITTTEKPATTTEVPDIEVDSYIEWLLNFWWEKYRNGEITWEQYTDIAWNNHIDIKTEVTEKETTYYFYDEEGRLLKTERVLVGSKHEEGIGEGSAQVENHGTANYQEVEKGQGGASGTVEAKTTIDFNNPIPISVNNGVTTKSKAKLSVSSKVVVIKAGTSKKISYTAKNTKGNIVKAKVSGGSKKIAKVTKVTKSYIKIKAPKSAKNGAKTKFTVTNSSKKIKITVVVTRKAHARVITSEGRIKLFKGNNKLYGWLEFNKATGELNWNGIHLQNVASAAFIKESWNVIVLFKNGDYYSIPYTAAYKGGKVKMKKLGSNGKTIRRDDYGFATNIVTENQTADDIVGK